MERIGIIGGTGLVDFEFKDSNKQDIEVDLIEPEKSITEFHLKVIKQ